MPHPFASRPMAALLLACMVPLAGFASHKTAWDLPGGKFKGTPVEVVGPLALFGTGGLSGEFVTLDGWKPADYERFAAAIATRPPRAARWSDAKGAVTSEIVGRALRVDHKQLVPVDFSTLPEPELLLVLYGSHNDGESWLMVSNLAGIFHHLSRVQPGRIAGLFYGVRHTAEEHTRMATEAWMPWLVADFRSQSQLDLLSRYAPREGPSLLLISRDGVPLLGAPVTDLPSVRQFVDRLVSLTTVLDATNARMWTGRAAFARAQRQAADRATRPPELIGTPLRPEVLRKYGVERIAARLEVAADGRIAAVDLRPESVLPAALAPGIREVLTRQAVVVPAWRDGHPVAGALDYHLVVPPEDRTLEAEKAWFDGEAAREIPIASWLVLRPVHVTEKDFGEDEVDASGVVRLRPLAVIDSGITHASQMSAFQTDWFAEQGAATVHPSPGDRVEIAGATLKWERLAPVDDYVDLQRGFSQLDYCIGYAWTEIEVPAETDAWLGIGSDDGMKIWLNGELVNDQWVRRLSRLDDDIVPLHLRKGKNQLLLKIQNARGDWSFISRLRARR